jgi:hypothetical protein
MGYGARDGAARRDEQRRIYAGELLFLQREIQLQMERYDSTSLSLFLSLVCIQMCLHAGLFSLPLPSACISLSLAHACTWRRNWLIFTPVWFKAQIVVLIAENSLAHACTWRRTWLSFTPVWFKAQIVALIAIRVSVSRACENLKGEGFSGMIILYNCVCFPCYKFHRVFGEAGKSMGRKNSSSSSSSQQADEGCPNFTWMGWPCHAKIARDTRLQDLL